jgi:hypothetical protein
MKSFSNSFQNQLLKYQEICYIRSPKLHLNTTGLFHYFTCLLCFCSGNPTIFIILSLNPFFYRTEQSSVAQCSPIGRPWPLRSGGEPLVTVKEVERQPPTEQSARGGVDERKEDTWTLELGLGVVRDGFFLNLAKNL